MKKLLFFTSFTLSLLGCASRENTMVVKEQPKEMNSEPSSSADQEQPHKSGVQQTGLPAESSPQPADAAAPNKENTVIEMPKHEGPDQNEVDSIKAAKAKLKKR